MTPRQRYPPPSAFHVTAASIINTSKRYGDKNCKSFWVHLERSVVEFTASFANETSLDQHFRVMPTTRTMCIRPVGSLCPEAQNRMHGPSPFPVWRNARMTIMTRTMITRPVSSLCTEAQNGVQRPWLARPCLENTTRIGKRPYSNIPGIPIDPSSIKATYSSTVSVSTSFKSEEKELPGRVVVPVTEARRRREAQRAHDREKKLPFLTASTERKVRRLQHRLVWEQTRVVRRACAWCTYAL